MTSESLRFHLILDSAAHTGEPPNTVILPDNKLIAFAIEDAFSLGVLSSSIHVAWTLANGSRLEDRPVYVKTTCFETFPFPALEEGELKQRIRDLGERLDAYRKRQQELHPDLTLTGIYNVLEKLRSGEALNAKDKAIHDKGLVSVLKQIHDELDATVLDAYGWQNMLVKGPPCSGGLRPSIANEEAPALSRLGIDAHGAPLQGEIQGVATSEHPTSKIQNSTFHAWPETMAEQVVAVRKLLTSVGPNPDRLSACFGRKSQKRRAQITAILDTLRALGHIT